LVEHFHGKEGVTSSSLVPGFSESAQLLVRDIESDVVRELKMRAGRHVRSAEEEHRQILREALRAGGPSPNRALSYLLDISVISELRRASEPCGAAIPTRRLP
jgi:plasmid stability protein